MTPLSVIAVDCGGSFVKLGLIEGGIVRARGRLESRSQQGLLQLLQRLPDAIHHLLVDAGQHDLKDCAGIGLALPVILDKASRTVLSAPAGKFADAANLDIPASIQRELGLPARLENDANAACLGEWQFGAGRGCSDFVMITLGTGIGTSVISDNRPLRGAHGRAGILGGHLIVTPNGRPCPHGGRGCVETEVGSRALQDIAAADPRYPTSPLASAPVDYQRIFALAGTDPLAAHLRTRALDYWGATLVNLVHSYDPQTVAIGGGLMRSADVILPALRDFLHANGWCPGGPPTLAAATTGEDAALLGLATLWSV